MKTLIPACLLLTVALVFSCQPELEFPNTPPENPPIKTIDSTLLIKSITFLYYNLGGTLEDSIVESYYYDTAQRRIELTWSASPGADDINGVKAVFSYNEDSLLIDGKYTYPPGRSFFGYEYRTITFAYDDEKILKSIGINYILDGPKTINFTKTRVGAGYRLAWEEHFSAGDWTKRSATFDGQNRCGIASISFPVNSGTGERIYETIDSVGYDALGNIAKVYHREIDPDEAPEPPILYWEFLSRNDKGHELAAQQRLIRNGIHNMPFGDHDDWSEISIIGAHLDYFHNSQYIPSLFQKARVINIANGGYDEVNAISVFDNKNRLVDFTGFFVDYGVRKERYKIAYYK
jgi:hypothetical protein